METMTIALTLSEYENFRAVAERFGVKFEINHKNDTYLVTAPKDKIIEWGYLEDEELDD